MTAKHGHPGDWQTWIVTLPDDCQRFDPHFVHGKKIGWKVDRVIPVLNIGFKLTKEQEDLFDTETLSCILKLQRATVVARSIQHPVPNIEGGKDLLHVLNTTDAHYLIALFNGEIERYAKEAQYAPLLERLSELQTASVDEIIKSGSDAMNGQFILSGFRSLPESEQKLSVRNVRDLIQLGDENLLNELLPYCGLTCGAILIELMKKN